MKPNVRHRKVTHRPPNAASMRAMQAVHAALRDDTPPPVDPLSLVEQWRREDDARRRRQGELKFSSA